MSDDISGVSSSFVHPTKLQPVQIGLGTLHHLVDKKYFPVNPNSPVEALLKLPCADADKNGAALPKLGIPADPKSGMRMGGKGKLYFEALELAARPEARVEFMEVSADGSVLRMDIVLGAGKGAVVGADRDGLSVSPPLPYSDLLRSLSRHLQNTEAPVERLVVWPTPLATLSFVFGPEKELQRTVVEERLLGASKLPADQVKAAVDESLKGGLLIANGTALRPHRTLAAFFERAAAAVVAELLLTPYDKQGNKGDRQDLRFFGKENDRITVLTARGALLKASAPVPVEDTLVTLMTLPKDALRRFLGSFLGVEG
jgi:hypothetical protein